jgi:hypothetical protein
MARIVTIAVVAACMFGCRSGTSARLMDKTEDDLVGAKAAGTETYSRLIDESMTKLLNRQNAEAGKTSKVAFIDLENKSAEELGDFREQLIQTIETLGENTNKYRMISRRFVQTALTEARLQPNQVMIPKNMRQLAQVLEQQNQPVDFLLYAVLTSGTTTGVGSMQRDYLLSLELINVRTGDFDKESARVRKEYAK